MIKRIVVFYDSSVYMLYNVQIHLKSIFLKDHWRNKIDNKKVKNN